MMQLLTSKQTAASHVLNTQKNSKPL